MILFWILFQLVAALALRAAPMVEYPDTADTADTAAEYSVEGP